MAGEVVGTKVPPARRGGRQPGQRMTDVARLRDEGLSFSEICERLGIHMYLQSQRNHLRGKKSPKEHMPPEAAVCPDAK